MIPDDKPPLPSPQEIMREVDDLRKRFEAIVESNRLQAKIMKATFDGLVAEGFTSAQALEIILKRGPYIGGSS